MWTGFSWLRMSPVAASCEILMGLRVGFEFLTTVSTKIAAFWVLAPCSLVEVYRRFRGPCCLHHQVGDDGGSKDL
jgi:hypothetical protein